MLFNFALACNLLLLSAVSANLQRRKHPHTKPTGITPEISTTLKLYAGAVLPGSLTSISGVLKVPDLSGTADSSATAQIGLDGIGCQGFLHTGVEFFIDSKGNPGYKAWYGWNQLGGNSTVQLYNFAVSAGDTIRLTSTSANSTLGYVMIEDVFNKNKTDFHIVQPQSADAALCGKTAEWTVVANDKSPLIDFGSVIFTDATAFNSSSGSATSAEGAMAMKMIHNNQTLASSSIAGSTVTVEFAKGG